MELISTPLAVVLVVVGTAAMAAATVVARREPLPSRHGRQPSRLAPLVPWVGSVLIVVLLVRGSVAGAGFLVVVVLAYVGVQRYRAATSGRD